MDHIKESQKKRPIFTDDNDTFQQPELPATKRQMHRRSQHSNSSREPVSHNRHNSFAPPRGENKVDYFIDGCEYFHAVAMALEYARSEIWIMDWWLSPELYLRRPPSLNEQYRLDRMILNAAQRGVKVYVIVYNEVPGVLSSKCFNFFARIFSKQSAFRSEY